MGYMTQGSQLGVVVHIYEKLVLSNSRDPTRSLEKKQIKQLKHKLDSLQQHRICPVPYRMGEVPCAVSDMHHCIQCASNMAHQTQHLESLQIVQFQIYTNQWVWCCTRWSIEQDTHRACNLCKLTKYSHNMSSVSLIVPTDRILRELVYYVVLSCTHRTCSMQHQRWHKM